MPSFNYEVKIKEKSADSDTGRLLISVGQPYHEGEKMKATLGFANRRFDRVVILANDTLQRFNLIYEGCTEEEAHRISRHRGDEWLERNNIAGEVYRWDDWKGPGFAEVQDRVNNLYRKNSSFRKEVIETAEKVWSRCHKNNPDLYSPERKNEAVTLSIDYILEETAVLSRAYEKIPGVSIYKGTFLKMWSAFTQEAPEDLPGLKNAHFMRIDFSRKQHVLQA